MQGQERKSFKIPNQISKEFHIWRSITLRDLIVLLPLAVVGFLLYRYVIPSSMDLQYRLFFSLLPLVLGAAFIFVHPIPTRKNIVLFQHLRWRIDYNRRQKRYFFRKKEIDGDISG